MARKKKSLSEAVSSELKKGFDLDGFNNVENCIQIAFQWLPNARKNRKMAPT